MGNRFVLIIPLILLLFGCAQVGTLTGGDKDYFAPSPIEFYPSQKSTRFSAQSISIRFDEFLELVNPQQTIFMVPNDARPEARLVNKTLHISWKEQLRPNTTYSIYLNGAVRDITEGNDSLMTYVFSTGDQIDSLSYETDLRDARTNAPAEYALLGLYTHPDSLTPLYFARSDESGHALISNIKKGTYTVRAFKDENRDQKIGRLEQRGFRSGFLALDSSVIDSLPIKMYTPADTTPQITSFKYFPPGMFAVGSNLKAFSAASFLFNGQSLLPQQTIPLSDSLLFFAQVDTVSKAKLVVNGVIIDTLQLFLSTKDRSTRCTLLSVKSEPGPQDEIVLTTNDLITKLDTAAILIRNDKDSTLIKATRIRLNKNSILFEVSRANVKNLTIIIPEGALETLNQKKHPSYSVPFTIKGEKEYGKVLLKAWKSDVPLFAELISSDGKTFRIDALNSGETVKPEKLFLPGEYRVRIVEDLDNDGIWDPGDAAMTVQPETIHDYESIKVRANWEVELSFDPNE